MVRKDLLYRAGSKALTFFIYFHQTAEEDAMPHLSRIPSVICVATVLFLALSVQAQAPGAPLLSSPTNGATNQQAAITLKWAASAGAKTYGLQVSTISTFATVALNQPSISVTSGSAANLSDATVYYWRVNASDSLGSSVWSSTWSFTTSFPNAPVLAAPANGAKNQLTSLIMTWNSSAGAASYSVEVSMASTFSSVLYNETGIATTSAPISILSYSTIYYWRANATDSSDTSAWSGIWSFTTGQMTGTPALVSPTNGAINQALSLTLSWNSVNTAASYAVKLSTVSSFLSVINYQME